MPLTIKSVTSSWPPTYAAGDLIVMFTQYYQGAIDGYWTQIQMTPTTWAYDQMQAGYIVATSSSDVPTPGGFGSFTKIYVISGASKNNPVSYASGHGSAWSSPNPVTITSVSGSASALRLTFAVGYGAGGNAPFSTTPTVSSGTVVDYSSYGVMVEGVGNSSFTIGSSLLGGGSLAWSTVAIEPAPASGFFSMF